MYYSLRQIFVDLNLAPNPHKALLSLSKSITARHLTDNLFLTSRDSGHEALVAAVAASNDAVKSAVQVLTASAQKFDGFAEKLDALARDHKRSRTSVVMPLDEDSATGEGAGAGASAIARSPAGAGGGGHSLAYSGLHAGVSAGASAGAGASPGVSAGAGAGAAASVDVALRAAARFETVTISSRGTSISVSGV